MNEFTQRIAETAYEACKRQRQHGRKREGVGIGQLNRAILRRYDTYVEGSVLEWASFYFDELGPETLSEMWWIAEAAMFRMVDTGELLSFNGIKSIEDVAIALGTRAVAKQRRQGRYPEVNHTEQDLLDFLVEQGQQQQLSLF